MNIFKNKQTHEYKEKERYRQRKARIWGYKLGKKYGIGDKIAKANLWADGHRRKTAGILFSVNTCIYLIGFILCMSENEADGNSIKDPMQDLAQVQPIFSQLHRIEDMKTVQKHTYVQLSNRAVTLKREVDSLMAMPRKTHQDSVLALQKYDELQTIMKK
ncbi:MAG: hypothetical protein IJV20_01705 [Prevotella sp.]|nr:hypothetical protein [Prevotella sp.]